MGGEISDGTDQMDQRNTDRRFTCFGVTTPQPQQGIECDPKIPNPLPLRDRSGRASGRYINFNHPLPPESTLLSLSFALLRAHTTTIWELLMGIDFPAQNAFGAQLFFCCCFSCCCLFCFYSPVQLSLLNALSDLNISSLYEGVEEKESEKKNTQPPPINLPIAFHAARAKKTLTQQRWTFL